MSVSLVVFARLFLSSNNFMSLPIIEGIRAARRRAPTFGRTKVIMIAHGFTVEMLGRLTVDGLATATAGTAQAGGRPVRVTWLRITDIGRQALAGV